MQIVGIKKIGFLKKTVQNDIWDENRTAVDPGADPVAYEHYSYFTSIDQDRSTLAQSFADDENGPLYTLELNAVVRREDDIALAREKTGQPQILQVETADGTVHDLGTEDYPMYLEVEDSYSGMATTELVMKARYQSDSPIL